MSSDSALSELLVYPGEFDESFSPEVYEYHMTVGVETENVVLSAVPSDENAVVTADIPETLVIGENKATISVKALSGDESVYTVYITRLAESLPEAAAFSLDDETVSETAETESLESSESEETAETMESSESEEAAETIESETAENAETIQ